MEIELRSPSPFKSERAKCERMFRIVSKTYMQYYTIHNIPLIVTICENICGGGERGDGNHINAYAYFGKIFMEMEIFLIKNCQKS